MDAQGKLLCWGYLTHLGCNQASCQRAHTKLQGQLESLDPCVQMQLIRRGGLRRMRQETQGSATEKIQRLRAEMSKDKAAKVQDGKTQAARKTAGGVPDGGPAGAAEQPKAGGERRVSWAVPAEMQAVDLTKQEEGFQEVLAGPDGSWLQSDVQPGLPHRGATARRPLWTPGSASRRHSVWLRARCCRRWPGRQMTCTPTPAHARDGHLWSGGAGGRGRGDPGPDVRRQGGRAAAVHRL